MTERLKVHVIDFTVVGSLAFPIDMLRYDACWPASEQDSHTIIRSLDRSGAAETYRVKLRMHREYQSQEATFGRWDSFGWKVVNHR